MTPQQRKEELFKGINNTKNQYVVIKAAYIIQCLGVEKTDELALWFIKMISTPNVKKKVLKRMAPHKRQIIEGYGNFDRLQLIHALQTIQMPQGETLGPTSNQNRAGADPVFAELKPEYSAHSSSSFDSSAG